MVTIDRVLDDIMKLDLASKETLYRVLHHRILEEKRKTLASMASEAEIEYQSGKAFTGSVEDVLKELDKDEQ